MSKWYAVRVGKAPGIYTTWDACKAQVQGFPLAEYKSFPSHAHALKYMLGAAPVTPPILASGDWSAWTDGACSGNPGAGGIGVVVRCGSESKHYGVGYAYTTNNRMELRAVLHALAHTPGESVLRLTTDSTYVLQGREKHLTINGDLWAKLRAACAQRVIYWNWTRGHAGHTENELCDQLARDAVRRGPHLADIGYTRR